MVWKPHVTVAAIIERNGEFLMVEEIADQQVVNNQPAGHLEQGEGFVEAIIREVQEETAWQFTPNAITGIYRWQKPDDGKTFIRICFSGTLGEHSPEQALDEGILRALWLSRDELAARQEQLRSPMVLRCIDDYLSGHRYSMEMFHDLENF
ncbi:NUDIX hydrolase [Sulfuriflexus mobilis]|uniref:NUDIX hydrolase n=1 Tax=Sulfuriflexus mobilis TaxID=1811807 RepID=UPI000F82395B|nr:NUDIX hydrolase [Sulfuriflexus mobilis]